MYFGKKLNKKIKIVKDLFVWGIVLVFMTSIAVGGVEHGTMIVQADESIKAVSIQEKAPEASEAVEAEENGNGEDKAEAEEERQTITFNKDASLRDALRVLAAKYKINIVPSRAVDGAVPITRLYDVTREEALGAILGHNFKYEQEGNFIRVYTAAEYKKIKEDLSRRVQKVFTLYYVNATEMLKLIRPVLSKTANVAATTAPAIDTTAGSGGDTLTMNDAIVVYDFPENIEKAAKIINELDVRPQQILIELTILKAKLSDTTEFGIDFSSIAGASITVASSEGFTTSGLASGIPGSSGVTAAFSIDDVTGFIRAIETVTDTTVLANPKILALNKQAGHILIGSEDGYLTVTEVTDGGNAIQEVEFLESGTKLKFRPFICKNGYIRMEINPEQSTGVVELVGDFALPSKTTTQVLTNIMIKDGKTVVIGGLFQDDITKTSTRVPLLGDLPLIGFLFRSTKDITERTELIVLITPHIIRDPEDIVDEGTEEIRRITEGAHKALSEINRTRIFEDRYKSALNYYNQGYRDVALSELNSILKLRPNLPEASRLKEKILSEIGAQTSQEKEAGQAEDQAKTGLVRGKQPARAMSAEEHYAKAVGYYTNGNKVEALYAAEEALQLRPTYMKALRLKEKIQSETALVVQQESDKWLRR